MPKKQESANSPVLLTIPPISVSRETYEFIEKNANGNMPEALMKWLAYYLDRQARGGIMLEPEDVQYLTGLRDGKPFRSSREVVRAVESGLNREEGQFTFKGNVDPALHAPLKDQAEAMGCTTRDILENVVNQSLTNSWAYSLVPERQLNFTERDFEIISKFIGKGSFFGADLARAIVNMTAEKAAV